MSAEENNCIVELEELVEKLLAVVKNKKLKMVLLRRRVPAKAK